MAQVRLGYPEFQKRGAEVLQVTHSTVAEAARYARFYPMPFPYLCDPDRIAHRRYGLELFEPSLGEAVESFAKCTTAVVTDLVLRGQRSFSPRPYFQRYVGKDSRQAVYVIDRAGVIRRVFTQEPLDALPSRAELLRELDALTA